MMNYIIRGILLSVLMISLLQCTPKTDNEQQDNVQIEEGTTTDPNNTLAEKYIGILHPPIPQNITERGGALATAAGQEAKDVQYSFSDVIADGKRLLWLSQLLERNEQGEVTWEVIDVAEVPTIAEDEELIIHACTRSNGDAVAAIAKGSSNKEKLTNIVTAWAINRNTGKLENITGDDVTCENEGLHAP